jgi:hypothetical protein
MDDLWGEEHHITPAPRTKRLTPSPSQAAATLAAAQCRYFGHTWQVIGMAGEKHCTVCGVKRYCPGCTGSTPPPKNAQPWYCTRHTPHREGEP